MRRFEVYEKDRIYTQVWMPDGNPKALFYITHGLGEHSECYHGLASKLVDLGFACLGWDLPGHGKSYGRRGAIQDFNQLIKAHQEVIYDFERAKEKELAKLKRILFGHSLGGLITTLSALRHRDFSYDLMVLSSPAFESAIQVPSWKKQGSSLLAKFAPQFTLWNEIRYENLTRDLSVIRQYEKDPLRHEKISAPFYQAILGAMDEASLRFSELPSKVFFQLAGNDSVISTSKTLELIESHSGFQFDPKIYPESYHEIFNDLDRDLAFSDLKEVLCKLF